MKLTEPDLKIKLSLDQLNSLSNYLKEVITNFDKYSEPFNSHKLLRKLIEHNLKTCLEKVAKLFFNNAFRGKKGVTLKINHSERMSLYHTTAYYALPLDINFVEFEIKNGLLK